MVFGLSLSECVGWCKWTHDTSALVAIQYTTYVGCWVPETNIILIIHLGSGPQQPLIWKLSIHIAQLLTFQQYYCSDHKVSIHKQMMMGLELIKLWDSFLHAKSRIQIQSAFLSSSTSSNPVTTFFIFSINFALSLYIYICNINYIVQ